MYYRSFFLVRYMVHTKKEQARFLDAAHEGDSRTVEVSAPSPV